MSEKDDWSQLDEHARNHSPSISSPGNGEMSRAADIMSLDTSLLFATGRLRIEGQDEPSPPSQKLLDRLSGVLGREISEDKDSLKGALTEISNQREEMGIPSFFEVLAEVSSKR